MNISVEQDDIVGQMDEWAFLRAAILNGLMTDQGLTADEAAEHLQKYENLEIDRLRSLSTPAIPCRFSEKGCKSPAVGIYHVPEGCHCWPDPVQALCVHHIQKAESSGEITRIADFRVALSTPEAFVIELDGKQWLKDWTASSISFTDNRAEAADFNPRPFAESVLGSLDTKHGISRSRLALKPRVALSTPEGREDAIRAQLFAALTELRLAAPEAIGWHRTDKVVGLQREREEDFRKALAAADDALDAALSSLPPRREGGQ